MEITVKSHNKIAMKKNAKYRIVVDKYIDGHRIRNGCSCSNVVLNLINGRRIWTRIRFDCGEVCKINCHCLEKV